MVTMKLGSKPDIFVLEGLTWRSMTELDSDVVVEVGEMSFYLHKLMFVDPHAVPAAEPERRAAASDQRLQPILGRRRHVHAAAGRHPGRRQGLRAGRPLLLRRQDRAQRAQRGVPPLRRRVPGHDGRLRGGQPDRAGGVLPLRRARQLEGLHQGAGDLRGRAPRRRGPPPRLPLHHRARLQGLRLRRRRLVVRPRGPQERQPPRQGRALERHRHGRHAARRRGRVGRGHGLVVRGRVVPQPAHVQAPGAGHGGQEHARREHRGRHHVLRGQAPPGPQAQRQLQQRHQQRREPQRHPARLQRRRRRVRGRPEVLPGGDRGAAAGQEGRGVHQVSVRPAPHRDAPARQPALQGEPGASHRGAAGGREPRGPARAQPRLHRGDALRHRLRAEDTGLLHVVHGRRAGHRVHVAGGGGGRGSGEPAGAGRVHAGRGHAARRGADRHGGQAHGRVPRGGGAGRQPQAAQVPGAGGRRARLRAARRRRHLPRHGHIPQVAPVAVGVGAGAAVPADELPEAVAGGVHARGAERAPAAAGGGAGALLRAAPPPHLHRGVVLRVRQRRRRRRAPASPGKQRRRHRPQGQQCRGQRTGRCPHRLARGQGERGHDRREGEGVGAGEGVHEHEAGDPAAGEAQEVVEHPHQEVRIRGQGAASAACHERQIEAPKVCNLSFRFVSRFICFIQAVDLPFILSGIVYSFSIPC